MKTFVYLALSTSGLLIALAIACSDERPPPGVDGTSGASSMQSAGVAQDGLESQQSPTQAAPESPSQPARSTRNATQRAGVDPSAGSVQDDEDGTTDVQGHASIWVELAAEIRARPRRTFQDCDELLEFHKAWGHAVVRGEVEPVAEEAEESALVSSAGAGELSPAGTNLRVAGVDESDYVKGLGDYLYVVAPGHLEVFSVRGQLAPERIATLDLPAGGTGRRWWWNVELLVLEDRAFVFSTSFGEPARHHLNSYTPITRVYEIDVSEPPAPEIAEILHLPDTEYVGARLVGARVHALFTTLKFPDRDDIEASAIEAWHPTYELLDSAQTKVHSGLAVSCPDVHLGSASSRGMTSSYLLAFDAAVGIGSWQGALLLAKPRTMFFSESSVYLLTRHESGAELHRFDLSANGRPTYFASLVVPGWLPNEEHIAEHDGTLRMWVGEWNGEETDQRIEVIELDDWSESDDSSLGRWRAASVELDAEIDRVLFHDGLAFAIDVGRTNNTWHLIDLAAPGSPEIADTFRFPGEAVYLHPLSDHRILLLGSSEVGTGSWKSSAAMFDVSDRTDVVLLDYADLGFNRMQVLYDHRSFAYAGATAWVLEQRDGLLFVRTILIGEDSLQVGMEVELEMKDWGDARPVLFDEQVVFASRFASAIEIRGLRLDDGALLGVQSLIVE